MKDNNLINEKVISVPLKQVKPLLQNNGSFWSNVVTVGEYAIDILTTFSGVGIVLKPRHLNKLRLLS